MRLRNPPTDNSKAMIFQKGLVDAVRKKFNLPPAPPASIAK